MQQGNEKQAFDYLYASALAEEETDVLDKFRWVNAFKRPAVAVRWGIGVQVTVSPKNYEGSYYPVGSTQSIPDKPTRSRQDGQSRGPGMAGPGGPGMAGPGGPGGRMNPGMSGPGGMYPGAAGTNAPAGSEVLANATGELGDELRRYLQERVDRGEYGETLVELASAPSRPAPGSGYPGAPGSGYPGAPGSGYPGAPGSGYPGAPGSGYPAHLAADIPVHQAVATQALPAADIRVDRRASVPLRRRRQLETGRVPLARVARGVGEPGRRRRRPAAA